MTSPLILNQTNKHHGQILVGGEQSADFCDSSLLATRQLFCCAFFHGLKTKKYCWFPCSHPHDILFQDIIISIPTSLPPRDTFLSCFKKRGIFYSWIFAIRLRFAFELINSSNTRLTGFAFIFISLFLFQNFVLFSRTKYFRILTFWNTPSKTKNPPAKFLWKASHLAREKINFKQLSFRMLNYVSFQWHVGKQF